MRYIFVIFVALFIWSASSTSNAQLRVSINFNLDNQPAWGPTGYDYVENYCLPDLDVYYNVPQHRYYYNEGGRWVSNVSLPYRYRGYDLYNSYKVVVNDRDPWQNNERYRDEYSKYRGQHDQQPIRDSQDPKYFQNRYHPEHNNWVKEHQRNNGNRNGYQKNNNGNDKSYQKDNNGRKSNNDKGVKKENNNGRNGNNKNNDKKDKKHNG